MKNLLYQAALYSPEVLTDFILELWGELDLENKALFSGILARYFIDGDNVPPKELSDKISNK